MDPTPTIPPQPPKHFPMLLVLLSLLAVFLLLSTGYLFTQTRRLTKELTELKSKSFPTTTVPTKESTCTTCIDNKYKMSFEVPTGYQGYIKKQGYSDDYTILKKYDQPQRVNSSIGISFFPGLYFSVRTCEDINFRNVGLNELYHKHLKTMRVGETKTIDGDGSIMDQFSQFSRISDTKIGGKTAMVFINKKIWEGGPDVVDKLYFIENGDSNFFSNYIVAIDALVYPVSNPNEINLEVLDQILSTFKFTN